MLRITRHAEGALQVLLILEGHIRLQWLQELERQADECRNQKQMVTIDLAGVIFVSASGLQLLRSLKAEGVLPARCPAILDDLMG